ncbi:arabinose efflux permease family protein [Bradyrhizobium sp. YR681]|uniref:multidrug effflux MFS transporter n=1 Tax=Bradyrhizobium sp. YR681 TaxID=1144344 RepID=UPI00026F97A7|nr:multidrug effflux MFS transporter [Bradyrhizobium sp. YR681]EJN10593.1 arabinose efflux permease family protein [Bradyrhizobium sp. YR681]
MKIQPASVAFTILLGFLAAVPYSGIDINLPALAATGAALGASPSHVGLTMSAFMLSLAIAPLIYGPISDRAGRKPVILFGLALFVVASLACAAAQSLTMLLICRAIQGIGAASTATTFAIIRDLFDEASGRAKIGSVMIAINVVTVIAPSAGAALLAIGGWRMIYSSQAVAGLMLIPAVLWGLAESAKLDTGGRIAASAVVKDYLRIVTHPVSMAFILVGAAAGSAVFAYVTGSSLYFISVAGLQPKQYGMIFSACSAAVMFGAFLDGQLGRRGVAPADVLTVGLVLLFAASSTMLVTTLAGWSPPAFVAALLIAVALAFGLSMPNLMNATMQPLPDIAGAVSAAAGTVQMTAGAIASGAVALLFDGRTALSMAAIMTAASLLALALYLRFGRSAGRRTRQDAAMATESTTLS